MFDVSFNASIDPAIIQIQRYEQVWSKSKLLVTKLYVFNQLQSLKDQIDTIAFFDDKITLINELFTHTEFIKVSSIKLPNDLYFCVLKKLSNKQILALSRVNKYFHYVVIKYFEVNFTNTIKKRIV